eukprot:TRINITY_DN25667_c0_g1_i1.p1 TRINITY_DN25667_c0_g1~~TRINITY_DN25667_c0_g1_i1.p1  ORF type:complete len:274 (+),score=50.93 TRINITY_DN25667_c0_g1_i1:155-976(+)
MAADVADSRGFRGRWNTWAAGEREQAPSTRLAQWTGRHVTAGYHVAAGQLPVAAQCVQDGGGRALYAAGTCIRRSAAQDVHGAVASASTSGPCSAASSSQCVNGAQRQRPTCALGLGASWNRWMEGDRELAPGTRLVLWTRRKASAGYNAAATCVPVAGHWVHSKVVSHCVPRSNASSAGLAVTSPRACHPELMVSSPVRASATATSSFTPAVQASAALQASPLPNLAARAASVSFPVVEGVPAAAPAHGAKVSPREKAIQAEQAKKLGLQIA